MEENDHVGRVLKALIDTRRLIPIHGFAMISVWKNEEEMLQWEKSPGLMRVAKIEMRYMQSKVEFPQGVPAEELAIVGVAFDMEKTGDVSLQMAVFCRLKA